MGENSKIEWCDHTFNPWIGCTKISPACDNCYAAAWDHRFGGLRWGSKADRTRTKPANWRKPVQWHKESDPDNPSLVFCASLADVFDNHKSIKDEWRTDLWQLISDTPYMNWLLLTKRPQNIEKYLPADWYEGYNNVWLGTTVENQEQASIRIPYLVNVPAHVHFLSCEPLLDNVDFRAAGVEWAMPSIDWVIAGGESGPGFRPTPATLFRNLRDQCIRYDIPFFFKQWCGPTKKVIKKTGRELDGVVWSQYPA